MPENFESGKIGEQKEIKGLKINRKVEEVIKGNDIFFENPPLQPKKDIADYIERSGFVVPKRFNNLDQAINFLENGGKVLVRSEHPREYNGASGVLSSLSFDLSEIIKYEKEYAKMGEIDWEDYFENVSKSSYVLKRIIGKIRSVNEMEFQDLMKKFCLPSIKTYCNLLGIKVDDFLRDVSFSYWENLRGLNRSIVADSAIPNRFHLFTTQTEEYEEFQFRHNYSIFDQGELVFSEPEKLHPYLIKGIPEVLKFYEKIRSLDGFDPNQCPLVEFQTYKEINWFLQYHLTRKFEPFSFSLDRKPRENEIEALFVRGSTPPEGLTEEIKVYFRSNELAKWGSSGLDGHNNLIFSEIMSRRRHLEVSCAENSQFIAIKISNTHFPKSKLFNPKVTVVIPQGEKFNEVFRRAYEKRKGGIGKFKLKVVSDGRRAFIEFL